MTQQIPVTTGPSTASVTKKTTTTMPGLPGDATLGALLRGLPPDPAQAGTAAATIQGAQTTQPGGEPTLTPAQQGGVGQALSTPVPVGPKPEEPGFLDKVKKYISDPDVVGATLFGLGFLGAPAGNVGAGLTRGSAMLGAGLNNQTQRELTERKQEVEEQNAGTERAKAAATAQNVSSGQFQDTATKMAQTKIASAQVGVQNKLADLERYKLTDPVQQSLAFFRIVQEGYAQDNAARLLAGMPQRSLTEYAGDIPQIGKVFPNLAKLLPEQQAAVQAVQEGKPVPKDSSPGILDFVKGFFGRKDIVQEGADAKFGPEGGTPPAVATPPARPAPKTAAMKAAAPSPTGGPPPGAVLVPPNTVKAQGFVAGKKYEAAGKTYLFDGTYMVPQQ